MRGVKISPLIFLYTKTYNIGMQEKINAFLSLNKLFQDNGFSLYLVGGTVRDYLLNLPLEDMDAVTDATPKEIKQFLPHADYTFERFGSVKYNGEKKVKFDITTMRKENEYSDSRHPNKIEFVKDLKIDVKRRDFTINALYMDSSLKVIDFVDGQNDLSKRVLRVVGPADAKIKEDPLRIIRAFRFAADYGFKFDEELDAAIRNNIDLLNKLNIEKVKQDLKKAKKSSNERLEKFFEDYNVKHLIDVIK